MSADAFRWQSAAITDVGKVRKLNEDSILERNDAGLWVVADGMGGHSAGDLASQLIINSLARLDTNITLATLVEQVEQTVQDVNDRLFAVANAHNQTSGSTVVLLLTNGSHAVVMWAGDSRCYRLRQGQQAADTGGQGCAGIGIDDLECGPIGISDLGEDGR